MARRVKVADGQLGLFDPPDDTRPEVTAAAPAPPAKEVRSAAKPVAQDLMGEYMTMVTLAAAYATGTTEEGVAEVLLRRGRPPHLGDEDGPPWRFRGWMLPMVMDLLPAESGIGWGRWRYWLTIRHSGKLPDEPIPEVEFGRPEEGHAAIKNLRQCIAILAESQGYGRGPELLIAWLAWALAVTKDPVNLDDAVQEQLYRTFCIDGWHERPADHLGLLLADHKGNGKFSNPRGFYPTPQDLATLIGRLIMDEGEDHRLKTISDCAAGTGRLLLDASNRSLCLYGNDVDLSCVLAARINGAIYAPWLAIAVE